MAEGERPKLTDRPRSRTRRLVMFWLGVVIMLAGLVGVAGAVVGLVPADAYAYAAIGLGTLSGVIVMIQNTDPRKRRRIRAFSCFPDGS